MDRNAITAMFDGLEDDWKRILGRDNRDALATALRAIGTDPIVPPAELIFNAFRLCSYTELRVIIIGQDPYIGEGQAMGLSFSVPRGMRLPPSVKNIYTCLVHSGLIAAVPNHGDLTRWARQGVLLLNAALTTRPGQSGAHKRAWEPYTNKVIEAISAEKRGLVFILLGEEAQKLRGHIGDGHHVLTWGHPSPLNAANRVDGPLNFRYCDVFSETNRILGQRCIDWNVDGELPLKLAVVKRNIGADDPMPPDDSTYIFTDGGSSANGHEKCQASWAFYITDGFSAAEASGIVPPAELGLKYSASNNRGELTAIKNALEYIAANLDKYKAPMRIVSDSEYSINSISRWYLGWLQKPDVLASRKNIDLISRCYELVQKIRETRDLHFEHVRGHAAEPADKDSGAWFYWFCNAKVDRLCNRALGRRV